MAADAKEDQDAVARASVDVEEHVPGDLPIETQTGKSAVDGKGERYATASPLMSGNGAALVTVRIREGSGSSHEVAGMAAGAKEDQEAFATASVDVVEPVPGDLWTETETKKSAVDCKDAGDENQDAVARAAVDAKEPVPGDLWMASDNQKSVVDGKDTIARATVDVEESLRGDLQIDSGMRTSAVDGKDGPLESKGRVFGYREIDQLREGSRRACKDEAYLIKCVADALTGYDVLEVDGAPHHLSLLHKALDTRQNWERLCEIRLIMCGLGDEGARALAERLPAGLKSLVLSFNKIGATGTRALAERLPAGLTSLNLFINSLGDEGAQALAERLPARLTSLNLSGNSLGYDGARALAERLPAGLTSLKLSLNSLGNEGAQALAERLPAGLTSLDLSRNKLGAQGARALAERLPAGLTSLVLSHNNLGLEGTRALAERLPAGLTSLDIQENNLGVQGVWALVELLGAGLMSLDLHLSDSEELAVLEILGSEQMSDLEKGPVLEYLGSEQEQLPVYDVLLLCIRNDGRRRRAQVLVEAKRKQLETVRVLQKHFPGPWPVARDVRVLLCGNPEVGKTCLRRSFTGQEQTKDGRTEGMEVEYLDAWGMRIALWDLGGQQEFHLLHSYLMPESTLAGKTTVFVLLLKLKFEDGGSFKEILQQSIDALWYWCRLIGSTTAPGRTRQVMVVFNHWVRSQQALVDLALLELRGKVELSKKFEGKIVFWGTHKVNARAGCKDLAVARLYNELMRQSRELVIGVHVPQLCQNIIGKLKSWREFSWERLNMPVMNGKEFLDKVLELIEDANIKGWLCENEVKAVTVLLDYLQDSGQIVYFKGAGDSNNGQVLVEDQLQAMWVILEMGWLGRDVVGGLLGLRVRRSQAQGAGWGLLGLWAGSSQTQGQDCEVHVERGEVIAAALQAFYESRNYKWAMVLQLLKELNLCYESPREDEREMRKLFVPSLLPKEATGEAFKRWNNESCLDAHEVGCRLRHSEESIFGLCFFQRLQTILADWADADLVNESKISYFRKRRVLILLQYDEQRDEIFVLARPKVNECSPGEVLAAHAAVTKKLMTVAATERNGVVVIKDILQPVCLTRDIDSKGYLGTLRSRMGYSTEQLRKLVAEEGDDAHVACPEGKHRIDVYDIIQKAELSGPHDEPRPSAVVGSYDISTSKDKRHVIKFCQHEAPVDIRGCQKKHHRREGALEDVSALEKLFGEMEFTAETVKNPTKEQYTAKVNSGQTQRHLIVWW